jgi:hypothetical protein
MSCVRNLGLIALSFAAGVLPLAAHADTVCTAGTCTVTIPHDPNAPDSTFGTGGSATNMASYTITTTDNGSNFIINLSTADSQALQFSNLYFDTQASTSGTGSNLGFEFGPSPANDDAFIPGVADNTSLAGTGVTAVFTQNSTGTFATITIPNSFFLSDSLGLGYTPAADGGLVSLHLSQTFGYSVVGGSGYFAAPVELGAANVSAVAPTPEPPSLLLLGTGMFCIAGFAGKKLWA